MPCTPDSDVMPNARGRAATREGGTPPDSINNTQSYTKGNRTVCRTAPSPHPPASSCRIPPSPRPFDTSQCSLFIFPFTKTFFIDNILPLSHTSMCRMFANLEIQP